MWGYAVNNRPEGSSSNLEQQQLKKECGWSSGRDLDVGLFQAARNVNRFNYMDVDAAFLEDDAADASVVTSSYHFSLSDVDSMFEQAAAPPPMKQMDDSGWEALNNLGDMDDIFGNNSSFQQHTLEVPSVSSSPDSAMSLRVASSPDEKQAGNVPSMAGLNKPVYWLAQQPCQEEASNLSCEDYQPPMILPPGMISDTTSLETSVPQHLQESMNYIKSFQPRRDSENPVGNLVQQTVVERRATNHMASTSGDGGNLTSEATVLYQLGSTMSRLDVGTRLCIRNSLYRLAKGAMSRTVHGEESAQSTARSLRNSLETCTNPIDRTVASLLFYKQEQQQQQQQEAATSGSVSPHSTISSNCSTWPEAGCSSSDHTTPVVMMFGNKLPLPPVYHTNTSYPSQAEFMSSKRRRK